MFALVAMLTIPHLTLIATVTECFADKSSWCQKEHVCRGNVNTIGIGEVYHAAVTMLSPSVIVTDRVT